VDVWSDVVCPWCWLGRHRFALARAARPDLPVVLRWHPFELDPDVPLEGVDRAERLRAKFGDASVLAAAQQRLVELGRAAGLEYRFELATRAPNTRAAHALVRLAGERQDAVVEALFRAYFHDGRDVGDLDVLAAVAAECGLDGTDVRARLAAREGFDAVGRAAREAAAQGVSGVPFFVFAGRWAVSGAQEVETFVRALDHVSAELRGERA
jgi:predicted DsbA family dithiol-disulfide isomerase